MLNNLNKYIKMIVNQQIVFVFDVLRFNFEKQVKNIQDTHREEKKNYSLLKELLSAKLE